MKRIWVCILLFQIMQTANAQKHFAELCEGVWQGKMYMYSFGKIKDSVEVVLSIQKTKDPEAYQWKTDYLSKKWPITKNYLLKRIDIEKGWYETDEQNGIVLKDYLIDNKLYSIFETEGMILTSSYTLINDVLVFEVTSGKKENSGQKNVDNISVDHLQRVYFKRK
jgi:hypothetical protein